MLTTSPTNDLVATLVRRFVGEVWNQRRLEVIDDILVPDYVIHSLQHGARNPSVSGAADVKHHVQMFFTAFPNLRVTLDTLVVQGDDAAAQCTFQGTHQGPFYGVAATGRPVKFVVITFFCAADGKLRQHATLFDVLGLLQQLGRLEPTAKLLS